MIVIVGNTKGGVGKTTLAVQIALARQTAGRAVLLIDADRQGSAQSAATMRADLLVVPVQPRAVDVWSLADIADLIDRAQEAREDDGRSRLRVLAALNLADPGDNRDTTETVAALAGFPQFTVAEAIVRRRKAIANAMAHGLAVAELQPRDPKACEEIEQLVSNVFNVTEIVDGNHTTIEAQQG